MFPTYLFTDPGFYLFSVAYVVSAFVSIWLLVLPHRWWSTPPLRGLQLSSLPRWLPGLFAILLIYQFFHQAEHVTQMYQFAWLGFTTKEAHGIVWFLDDEWNHFLFNTGYLTGLFIVCVPLLKALRKNHQRFTVGAVGLIMFILIMESWHVVEHTFRIVQHIQGTCQQCPGIVDSLTGLNRLVYHFWLNFFALIVPGAIFVWYGLGGVLREQLRRRAFAKKGRLQVV